MNTPKWWWKIQKRKCYEYIYIHMYRGAGDSNNKKVRKLNLFARNIYWCLLLEALLFARAWPCRCFTFALCSGCIRQTWHLNCNEESSINRPRFPRIEWFSEECLTAETFCASGWIDLFWHFFCSCVMRVGIRNVHFFFFCDSDKAMELPQCETIYMAYIFFVGKPYNGYERIEWNGQRPFSSALCFSMLLRAFQYYVLIELMHMPNTSNGRGQAGGRGRRGWDINDLFVSSLPCDGIFHFPANIVPLHAKCA